MIRTPGRRQIRNGSNDTPQPWVPIPTRAAATVLFVEVGFALVASGDYIYRLLRGESTDRSLLLGLVGLFLVGAAGLAALGRGLLHGASWPRTPTVVWNMLLIPVAVSLFQSEQPGLAVATVVLAGTAIVGTVLGARRSTMP